MVAGTRAGGPRSCAQIARKTYGVEHNNMNKTIAIFAFAAAVTSTVLPASASTFTISGSGSSFTITRSGDTSAAETVRYRTVPLSAFPWQHYNATNGVIVFASGQTSTNIVVSERSPTADAYKYQIGSTRSYRFEVLSWQGAALASADRSKSTGTSIPSSGVFSEKNLAILTPSAETMYSDKGYLKNAYGTNSISRFFTATATPVAFYELVGAELRMTLDFKAKEKNNGYQYVQILVDKTTTCDDRSGCSDGDPGNINLSRYMAGFDHVPSHENTTYALYSFPVTSQTNNCLTVENAWNNGVNNRSSTPTAAPPTAGSSSRGTSPTSSSASTPAAAARTTTNGTPRTSSPTYRPSTRQTPSSTTTRPPASSWIPARTTRAARSTSAFRSAK